MYVCIRVMSWLPGQGSGGPQNFIYIGQIQPKLHTHCCSRVKTPYTLEQAETCWRVGREFKTHKRKKVFISLIFVDAVIALANVAERTSSFIFKKSSFSVLVGHTVVALTGVVSWACSVLGDCQLGPSSGGAKFSLRHVIRRAATVSWDRLRFR